jgi:hypothetical protein
MEEMKSSLTLTNGIHVDKLKEQVMRSIHCINGQCESSQEPRKNTPVIPDTLAELLRRNEEKYQVGGYK